MSLVGFTYDVLHGTTEVKPRLEWLARDSRGQDQFHPQPYEPLAKVLREIGHQVKATEVMVAKEQCGRKFARESRYALRGPQPIRSNFGNFHRDALLWLLKARDDVFGLVAGYGHKPHRAIPTLVAMIALTSTMAFFYLAGRGFCTELWPYSDIGWLDQLCERGGKPGSCVV